jgi:hypothetical protein
MKRLILIFALMLMPFSAAIAQPAPPTPPANPDTEAYIKLVDGEVTVEDVVADGQEVYKAVQAYRDAKKSGSSNSGTLALMLAGLAAFFKFLLSLIKVIAKKEFWKSRKGKITLRLVCIGLGLCVLVISKFAGGAGWEDAILLAFSGPGALAAHEITTITKKDKPPE